MKRLILFTLVFALFFSLAGAQNFAPQPFLKGQLHLRTGVRKAVGAFQRRQHFDAQYYRLFFKIDLDHRYIQAHMHGRFQNLQDTLSLITLDFTSQLKIDSVSGAVASYVQDGSFLDLKLKHTYQKGDTFSVDVYYSGNPEVVGSPSFVFDYLPNEDLYVWTLSEPYGARDWWPCKDTPADKADSVDVVVTVPENCLVASNGILINTTEGPEPGLKTFYWHEGYPIATYLVSLVAGPLWHFQDYYHYSLSDSMLLDYYVFPEAYAAAQVVFKEVPDYLDALSYFYGPYPFLKEKYGMAQFGWGGGMEHQTITSVGGVYPTWRFLYVHELGHQWFGDKVTCASWKDIWLNEGFATYSEALYAQWAGFFDLPPGMKAYHAYMDELVYTDDGTIIIPDTSDFSKIFSGIVYHKGAWVLHMLRHVIGDSAFFASLRAYLDDSRWTYGSVTTQDFIQTCERISGKNLQTFFDQWLNYPFYPKYEYKWKVFESRKGNVQIGVTIRQTQKQTLYVMPLDIRFVFADSSDTTISVENNQFTQDYTFVLKEEPVQILLDPDHWVLSENREETPATYTQVPEIYRIYPNPSHEGVWIELRHLLPVKVTLNIYSVLGQKVRTLNQQQNQFYLHTYYWDGKNDRGEPVASGVYFVRTAAEMYPPQQKKIVILR